MAAGGGAGALRLAGSPWQVRERSTAVVAATAGGGAGEKAVDLQHRQRIGILPVNTSYPDAFKANYRNLPASSDYRVDYQTMQPARDEGLFRAIRQLMSRRACRSNRAKGNGGAGSTK